MARQVDPLFIISPLQKPEDQQISSPEMAFSTAKRLVFLTMAISLLLLCSFSIPSYSAPLCFERFACTNGGRRLPYYPPPPVENRQTRQDSPRAPPIRDQSAPPSPSTII